MKQMNAGNMNSLFRSRNHVTTLAGVAALVALVVGATFFTSAPAADEPAKGGAPSMTVTATVATQEQWPISLAASGSIEPWGEAIVGAEVNGQRIASLLVNVGDRVQQGQVLARFADEFLAADLAQAEAALEEAKAREAQARANADRAATVRESGALSPQEQDQYAAAASSAAAQAKSARARRDAAALMLRKAAVVAPDAGVISARNAALGAVVPTGTELFRLIRQERLEWRAEVAEAELSRVKRGGKAQLRTAQGVQLTGTIRSVSPQVSARSRTAIAYIDLPGAAAKTAAGTFATGRLLLGESAALTLPQAAVVMRDGFGYVYVLQSADRVRRLRVSTGRRVGDRIEITGGLAAGARVANEGAGFLNDGDKVRVVTAGGRAK
jgi:RND family efflux transporter MFP subunit